MTGKNFLSIFFVFWICPVLLRAQSGIEPRQICSANDKDQTKIDSCLKDERDPDCDGIPKDQLRNCFDPKSDVMNDMQGKYFCGKGVWEGVADTVKGAWSVTSNAYKSATDHSAYTRLVNENAVNTCENDKDVIDSRENYRQIVKNIGPDLAIPKYLQPVNDTYMKCMDREKRHGQNLGISLTLPKYSEIKPIFTCLNEKAQTEMACKVVGPMVVGGVVGAGAKAALRAALARAGVSAAGRVELSYAEYIKGIRGKLAPKELESLKHQKDLLTGIRNPEVASRIQSAGVDLDALTKGILDSDFGKLDSGQRLLTQASPESDRLLNVLRGQDTTSLAGRAYQKHMSEIGQAGRTDFNPSMSNDQIRKVIADRPILAGELHELPGMSRAIQDLDSGAITERQFIDRLNANRSHNHSPEETGNNIGASGNNVVPFWDDLEQKFIPMALKGDPLREKFFQNTVYDSGVRSADGVVVPRYPAPTQNSVIVHSVFDRLSQGTGGGNVKIFFESSGKLLADNPKVPIGEISDLTNFGAKNGLNNLANQLTGTVIKKADGSVVQTFSNAERTNVQFRGLQQAIEKSSATSSEKSAMSELARAGRDRNLAYDDFSKNNISYLKDDKGNVLKMSFKDADGKYLGTIGLDTPTDEAMSLLAKFNQAEEKINGDPFRDLMSPRLLSKSEIAAYGFPARAAYYYCHHSNMGFGGTGGGNSNSTIQPQGSQ